MSHLLDKVSYGVVVAETLSHSLALHEPVFAVHPVVHEFLACSSLALRDFVLMVGEHVLPAARVNVECFAQIFHGHGGAFNVPAGSSLAYFCFPEDIAVSLIPSFPQREISGFSFLVLGHFNAGACFELFSFELRKLSIIFELGYIIVD